MISEIEKQMMKKVIGNRFIPEVKSILEKNGLPVKSSGFISHVFNGRYENLEIEKAFLELYLSKSEELKVLKKAKKSLNKKEPGAVTPGSITH